MRSRSWRPRRIVSPVYQEIHRHELPHDEFGAARILLTGHLFEHHFSAAVSMIRDPHEPSFGVLEFDVADRCRAPVQVLAATYLVNAGSSELATAGPQAIVWTGLVPGVATTRLEILCDPPSALAMAEAGRQATRVQALAAIDPGSSRTGWPTAGAGLAKAVPSRPDRPRTAPRDGGVAAGWRRILGGLPCFRPRLSQAR